MIIHLEPYFESKAWASSVLNSIYGCGDDIGEAWVVSGLSNKSSIIKNGKFKGFHFSDVTGELYDLNFFPIIIKVIANKDKLSVQVHPDDNLANRKHGKSGKLEVFYILENNNSKNIILGTKVKDKNELLDSLFTDSVLDKLIYKTISPNDLIEIAPGTIHSILEDSFVLEIQQSSDITYRLYDFDRIPRRGLHIEEAIAATNVKSEGKFTNLNDAYSNKYFSLEKIKIKGKIKRNYTNIKICFILKGNGSINNYNIKEFDTYIVNDETVDYRGNFEMIEVSIEKR